MSWPSKSRASWRAERTGIRSHPVTVVLLGLLAGCGYHFPAAVGFPAGIETVYLDAQPSDTPLTRKLTDLLRREQGTRLVSRPEQADAVLRIRGGEIASRAAAINRQGVATEYEVKVQVDYRLVRMGPEGGRVLRRADGLDASRTVPFEATTSPATEEANKRRLGQQASEELARRILDSARSRF